jgi:XTP/dITP diphosphohydrolase
VSETLLIGTANPDKAAELAALLEGLPWEVKSLRDFPPVPEPEEEGATFEANATLKALYYGQQFNVACVADDSGLVVDALGGRPGVLSSRYAGPGCSYADNNAKVLKELEGVPDEDRTARFICCAVLAPLIGAPQVERGTVEGRIAHEARGEHGFGYDPIFIPDGHDITFGEMPPELKHSMSHRGRAFRKLRTYLESLA